MFDSLDVLNGFFRQVVVSRRDEGIRRWKGWLREDLNSRPYIWLRPDFVPPSPFLVAKDSQTQSSRVVVEPHLIDAEFRKAWMLYFCRSGQPEVSADHFLGFIGHFLPQQDFLNLPRITGRDLQEVARAKKASAGGLDGWAWNEIKALPLPWFSGLAILLELVESTGTWPQGLLDAYPRAQSVARVKQHVALKSGVCEDAFYLVWEGRVLRDGDTLGDTQLHMCSYLRGVGMGRQPQISGQWVCQSCGMGGCWPTRQSCYRCGAPGLGGNGGQRPPRETHYPGQPSNQGLPINPTKRVLRGFNGGTGQSPPKVVLPGPVPSSNQGLADPALILPLLQSLGLPEEVLEAVRARIATQKAPKKVSREKQLSLLRAKIDMLAQQITRLNRTVLYHLEKLRENDDALSTKQSEHAQLQVEFRDLTDKGFTPTPSPVQTPPQSDHGSEEGEACDSRRSYGTHS